MRKIYLALTVMIAATASFAQGDDCPNAVPVGPGIYTANGPNTGGGASNVCFGGGATNADWYTFTAPCTGTIDVGSDIDLAQPDTRLSIYSGGCGTLVCEDNDDDGGPGFTSLITGMPVTAGTTYYIEWDDRWDNFAFDWQLTYLVGGVPQPVITGITGSNTTFSSIDIDWTPAGAETNWTFEYGISGFTQGTGTIWNVSAASDTSITGLQPETTYDVYISDPGDPCTVGIFTFTTLAVCPVPTGLTATPGPTDAMLDWNPGGIEVRWDVEYGTTGFLLGSGTQAYGIVLGSDTTVTGLTGLTDYDWYARAVCDVVAPYDTVSLWVGPEMFTTGQPCADPGNLDTINSDPFNTDIIWTPGGTESMWNVEWGEAGFTLGGVGSNPLPGVTAFQTLNGLTPGTTYEFYLQAVCGASPDSSSMWVGPFTWTQPIFCTDPTPGNLFNLTTTSVDFEWTPNGTETNWTVEYGVGGFTLGTGMQMMSTNDTVSVTGLTPDTQYCFYVQANCGSTPDSSSAWMGPVCITTPVACPQPTNLNAINITTTAANLMWQAGGSETEWDLEWGTPGFTPGTGAFVGNVNPTSTNPYYATGLNVGEPYEFYVRGICGAGDTSAWSGPYSFQTLCGTIMAPYDQNFDAQLGTPSCWSNPAIGEQWVFDPSGGNGFPDPAYGVAGSVDHTSGTGNYAWIDASGTIGNNELVSPMIDISALTTPQAGFWILSNNITDGAQNTITLEVWNGLGWTLLGEYGGNSANWVEIAYTLPMGIPSVTQFRLVQVVSTTGTGIPQHNDLLVDDFFVREEVPCPPVSAGTANTPPFCQDGASGPVELFAALNGADGDGTFYFPSVTAPTQSFNATGNSMLLTGLTEGVDYTFDYVVNNGCDADTVSITFNWVQTVDAGGDGSVTTCVNHDVFLFQELTGSPNTGGTWSDDDGAGYMVNGIFSPAVVPAGTYNFSYVVDNGTCSDTSVVTVTVEDCASVEENEIILGAFPNPVQDVLTVQLANVDAQVQVDILTVDGKLVSTPVTINTGNLEIDMSELASGAYILRVVSEGLTQELRVVKQ